MRGLLSGSVVVGASELAKRDELTGALLISIPLTSILAIILLYNDTSDTTQVADFTTGILWLVIPSLVLFISLPIFLRRGIEFWPSLGAACLLTIIAYYIGVQLATKYAEIT